MRPVSYILATLLVASLPYAAYADCATFEPYDDTGNYQSDIAVRVAVAQACPQFEQSFDLNTFIHAQRSVVGDLLVDQEPEEAYALAMAYFDAAIARFNAHNADPNNRGILSPEGIFNVGLRVHMWETGMLAVGAESTLKDCSELETLDRLLGIVHAGIEERRARFSDAAEQDRAMIEQQLRDFTLEEWQQMLPDIKSMDDVRNNRLVRDLLDTNIEPRLQDLLQDEYLRLFRARARNLGGRSEQCLAEAFLAHPDVVSMSPEQRLFTYTRTMVYIERLGVLGDD